MRMYRCMLGGPFFTTVPSGRVGRARDSAYFSNEAFVQGVRRSERDDQVLCQIVSLRFVSGGVQVVVLVRLRVLSCYSSTAVHPVVHARLGLRL